MSVITTLGADNKQNGVLVPLWTIDSGIRVEQVYLTTVLPWKVKGPHLHKVRRGLFACVQGEVLVVVCQMGMYKTYSIRRGDPMILVPPGVPAALYNPLGIEALVLNFPSPPWREDDKDEWPVEDWNWKP